MDTRGGEPDQHFVDPQMDRPEVVPFPPGEIAMFSSVCPGRTLNEDAASLIRLGETTGVLAVADGMGGQPAGERAARTALESLGESLSRAAGGRIREAILDGFERANRAIRSLRVGAGTTLAVVEIRGNFARAYHVGDSEILVVGGKGKVKLKTVSHSPVGYGVEAGLIDHRDALEHEDRHLLSNLVGSPDMRIEIGPILRLKPRDRVLLGSDGLFDNLHLPEIVETIRRGPLEAAAGSLAREVRTRMGRAEGDAPAKPDDLTFLLYRSREGRFPRGVRVDRQSGETPQGGRAYS